MAWSLFAKKPKMMPADPTSFDSVIGAGMVFSQAGEILLEGTLLVQGVVKASRVEGAHDLLSTLYVSGEVIANDVQVDHIVVMPKGHLSAQSVRCNSIKVAAGATLSTDALTYDTINFEPGSNVTAQLQKNPQAPLEATRSLPVVPQPAPGR